MDDKKSFTINNALHASNLCNDTNSNHFSLLYFRNSCNKMFDSIYEKICRQWDGSKTVISHTMAKLIEWFKEIIRALTINRIVDVQTLCNSVRKLFYMNYVIGGHKFNHHTHTALANLARVIRSDGTFVRFQWLSVVTATYFLNHMVACIELYGSKPIHHVRQLRYFRNELLFWIETLYLTWNSYLNANCMERHVFFGRNNNLCLSTFISMVNSRHPLWASFECKIWSISREHNRQLIFKFHWKFLRGSLRTHQQRSSVWFLFPRSIFFLISLLFAVVKKCEKYNFHDIDRNISKSDWEKIKLEFQLPIEIGEK